jgi:hypothetical protein
LQAPPRKPTTAAAVDALTGGGVLATGWQNVIFEGGYRTALFRDTQRSASSNLATWRHPRT